MIPRYTRSKIAEVWSEENKFRIFLEIELLVCEALAEKKQIPPEAVKRMRANARFDVQSIHKIEQTTHHDIIAFLEDIGQSLQEDAQFLHRGLTSSDLLDTTLAYQLAQASSIINEGIDNLLSELAAQAEKHQYTVCAGRTHGVHAEPYSFGLKMARFYDELNRNKQRFLYAVDQVTTGKISGAVGIFAHQPMEIEEYVCKKLHLHPAAISTQIISRDRHAFYLSTLALLGAMTEQIALEIRHLQKTEVQEACEPFSPGQKGSSAMPHKRNPIICERLCGQARLLRSYLQAGLENIAVWHERDISHSSVERVILPDATIILDYMLDKACHLIAHMEVNDKRMQENLEISLNLPFSQSVLVALMEKGMQRKQAYEVIQKTAMEAWNNKEDFKKLILKTESVTSVLSPDEIAACFDINKYLCSIDAIYKRIGLKTRS
jgi:adenylosuccinate lyase